jgi:hypothetical protein
MTSLSVPSFLSLLFPHDITLLSSGPNLPDLIKFVNDELFKITTYFRLNKLALHPQKTQFMLISNSPSAINYPTNFLLTTITPLNCLIKILSTPFLEPFLHLLFQLLSFLGYSSTLS